MAQDLNEYIKKFNRCILEYTTVGDSGMEEDDPNAAGGMDPMAAGGAAPAADPMAMGGGMPAADPMAMGGGAGMDMNGDGMPDDPNAMGGAAPAAAPAPAPTEAPGFNPQGGDPNAMGGADPMAVGADPNAAPAPEQPEENSEDVSAIKDGQKETEEKLDALTGKFDQLMGALDSIEKRISDNDEKINAFQAEMEKRNPTSVEKMSLRTQKSGPFTKSPEEYWEAEAPDNYSPEDDNNGVGQQQYEITKDDIDNFNDWKGISKTFDDERERMGLRNLLGY